MQPSHLLTSEISTVIGQVCSPTVTAAKLWPHPAFLACARLHFGTAAHRLGLKLNAAMCRCGITATAAKLKPTLPSWPPSSCSKAPLTACCPLS